MLRTLLIRRKTHVLHLTHAFDAMFLDAHAERMTQPNLNLLTALDVLLAEGSVARAARRLRLSQSAMSRTLARLRQVTGDPLLVRVGRGLVPTPHALELRGRVGHLVQEATDVLRPAARPDLGHLERSFTLRCSDGFVEKFGLALMERVAGQAPGIRLRFVQKADKSNAPLRDGSIDLDTGVIDDGTSPEFHTRVLFHDRLVGVVRKGHPLCRGKVTPARYAAGRHIHVSRRGLDTGLIDEVLHEHNLQRHRRHRHRLCLGNGNDAIVRPDRQRARAIHVQPA